MFFFFANLLERLYPKVIVAVQAVALLDVCASSFFFLKYSPSLSGDEARAACSWLTAWWGCPSVLIVRCRRPGLPAARGGSPARAGSAAIPRVRARNDTAADRVQEALLSKLSHPPRGCRQLRRGDCIQRGHLRDSGT